MSNSLLISTFLLLFCFLLSCETKKQIPAGQWKETIGTLSNRRKGGNLIYHVDGKDYRTMLYPLYGHVKPEYYIVKYDSLDPSNVEVCYYCETFLEGEQTFFLNARILKIFDSGPRGWCVHFEYNVNGTTIDKTQGLPPNFRELYPNLKKNQIYQVECLIDDPQRSILRLDRPENK